MWCFFLGRGSMLEFAREGAADVFEGYCDVGFFTASEQVILTLSTRK